MNKKYISMAKTAYSTATRDLAELVEKEMLVKAAGVRSTKHTTNW